MSRGQRVGLIALAIIVAAVAFVLARPDDASEKAEAPAQSTETAAPAERGEPTATTDTRPEQSVVLRDHKPVGGIARIEVKKGDLLRMVVESDAPDRIHLHGYDVEKEASPQAPARFSLRADLEGVFEVESHEAEHGGGEPLIARLVVEPS